jgi:hypothetical protein
MLWGWSPKRLTVRDYLLTVLPSAGVISMTEDLSGPSLCPSQQYGFSPLCLLSNFVLFSEYSVFTYKYFMFFSYSGISLPHSSEKEGH